MTVYAINKRTKEHRVIDDRLGLIPIEYMNREWHLSETDADGWIPWSGGECPVPYGSSVEVMNSVGGVLRTNYPEYINWNSRDAATAYRPILNADDEPEATDDAGLMHNRVHRESGVGRAIRTVKTKQQREPEWNGEGLPPVGCEVDVVDDGSLMYGEGESGPVVGHIEDTAIVRMSYGLGCFKADVLRPIRSDEDRAVEEMVYKRPLGVDFGAAEKMARHLYRNGYRKEK